MEEYISKKAAKGTAIENGEKITLTGTIKEHSEYKGGETDSINKMQNKQSSIRHGAFCPCRCKYSTEVKT